MQNGAPNDVPFGRYVRDTGLAAPLVLLTFGSIWLFPLIASLVAGDIVAAEDGNGTLKTILTRSVTRGQLFAAKVGAAITYALLALVAMAAVSITEATIAWGFNPITSLSGTTVSAWRGLLLVIASLGVYALAAARDHDDRRAALDRHAQLRRCRGRSAHDRAADAADRDPARASGRSSPTS